MPKPFNRQHQGRAKHQISKKDKSETGINYYKTDMRAIWTLLLLSTLCLSPTTSGVDLNKITKTTESALRQTAKKCPCKCVPKRKLAMKQCKQCKFNFICEVSRCTLKTGKRGVECCEARRKKVPRRCPCKCTTKKKAKKACLACKFGRFGAGCELRGCAIRKGRKGVTCCKPKPTITPEP